MGEPKLSSIGMSTSMSMDKSKKLHHVFMRAHLLPYHRARLLRKLESAKHCPALKVLAALVLLRKLESAKHCPTLKSALVLLRKLESAKHCTALVIILTLPSPYCKSCQISGPCRQSGWNGCRASVVYTGLRSISGGTNMVVELNQHHPLVIRRT